MPCVSSARSWLVAATAALAFGFLHHAAATIFSHQRDLCQARLTQLGGCLLFCMWSPRLCQRCCSDSTVTWSARTSTSTSTAAPEGLSTVPIITPESIGGPDEAGFPPSDTVDAVVETAAHILAIASGEDSERIRIWLEDPESNAESIRVLAGKLASIENAPYSETHWLRVLFSSRERPFTLLRQALSVRRVQQQSAGSGPGRIKDLYICWDEDCEYE